ncbi:hypothetical protein [Mycobacterium shigaense]|uniref:Uncharacterized protein n=1 Tax=Mycobacterium shigaense TaxID=722731 RepID=A0A1Z4ENF5_9MYCO|nr:hypothetical protein [Mycobacterium shigaense]BAX94461.1 hypothetical protein MSG_04340 [Mycobacterium shigaense]
MRKSTALLFVGAIILAAAVFWDATGVAERESSVGAELVPLTPKFRACAFTFVSNGATNGKGSG